MTYKNFIQPKLTNQWALRKKSKRGIADIVITTITKVATGVLFTKRIYRIKAKVLKRRTYITPCSWFQLTILKSYYNKNKSVYQLQAITYGIKPTYQLQECLSLNNAQQDSTTNLFTKALKLKLNQALKHIHKHVPRLMVCIITISTFKTRVQTWK